MNKKIFQIVSAIIGGVLAVALMIAFSGCTTTKYVPVEHHATDTLIQTKVQKDSVWLHDSIHVREKGDTVRIERWRTKYISKEVHDTLYQAKRDSVPVPYEVVKEMPAKLTTPQIALIVIGMLTVIGLILYFVYWIKRKFKL